MARALKPLHNCNIFPQKESLPYFGVPGLGLNAGVVLMNLTRFYFFPTSLSKALKITYLYLSFFRLRDLPGGGFTEISRYIWQKHRLAMYIYIVYWVHIYLIKPLNNINDQIDWILIGWLWSNFVWYFWGIFCQSTFIAERTLPQA